MLLLIEREYFFRVGLKAVVGCFNLDRSREQNVRSQLESAQEWRRGKLPKNNYQRLVLTEISEREYLSVGHHKISYERPRHLLHLWNQLFSATRTV